MAHKRSQSDSYTKRAQKEGYPARSVYKLKELQRRFAPVPRGGSILDIGAAPGSWSLYVHRKLLGSGGRITAVDLLPLKLSPLPNRITPLQGDAFSPEIMQKITELGPYDAVISDAAPATTGNRTIDTARSEELGLEIINLARTVLVPGGNLVIKLFQGGGEAALTEKMRRDFSRVKSCKPKASRSESFEIFLIGTGKHTEGGL